MKVDLPNSVVQKELIILSPLVFNYYKKDLNVREFSHLLIDTLQSKTSAVHK